MSDKVVDISKARERLRSPKAETLDYDEELQWAADESDAVEEEINGLAEHIGDLTNYMLELATYLGAITIAKDCEQVPADWVEIWTQFKADRELEAAEEEDEIQFEIVFEPEFDLEEDNNDN